ncbi:DUF2092 domain-containing protein [Solidesulfovibrio sp.]
MGRILLIVGLLSCLAAAPAQAATGAPAAPEPAKTADITPEAAAPVAAMCGLLASRPALAFAAEVNEEHVYPNGQIVELTRFAEVALVRPDKLHIRITGDERDRVFVYDGTTVTVADYDRGVYAVIDAPGTIDATLTMLAEKYGIIAPLTDLLYADPCKEILANVRTGDCVGVHTAAGVACDHMVFTQKNADWQLWVEKGKAALPRKVGITDKGIMGWPQYSAVFTDWDLTPRLPAGLFSFTPAKDMRRIDFIPLVAGQETK